METKFLIDGFSAVTEEDIFEKGCIGHMSHTTYDVTVEAENVDHLRGKLMAEFGVSADNIEFDACDEVGRVDVQRYENDMGDKASDAEMERWKKGEERIWLATYTGYCYRQTLERLTPENA